MLEAGIYSILLKWGLETVSGVVRDKDPKHVEIVLEAIKTRNAIVLKRFDYAWAVAQEINDLLSDLEGDLANFISDVGTADGKEQRVKAFVSRLRDEFHPKYYRRVRKIRIKLEATNDLFSAYSIEFQEMLRFDRVKTILDCGPQTVSDLARTYRHLWDTFGAVIATLIRVTSYDLRFWLTDVSYFRLAEKQAEIDCGIITEHFSKAERKSWTLSIENHATVNAFWEAVEKGVNPG